MLRNRKVYLSFQQHELSSNFEKYKKLAELESKLIRNDFVNSQLNDEVQRLREENQKLREKIQEKEVQNTMLYLKNNKSNQTSKVNSHFDATNVSTIQALKHKYRQFQETSYRDISKRVAGYFHKPKEHSFGYTNQENLRLDKNVYITKQPLKQRHVSLQNSIKQNPNEGKKIEKMEEKHGRTRSITEGQDKQGNKNHQTSKFPSNMNDFEGKKAQSRFLQCQGPQKASQASQNEFNRWKSQENFGFKSEFLGHMKSQDIRKKKTYLSIVSVSSKENKKDKQN